MTFPTSAYPRPQLRDWAVLAISFGFAVIGLLLFTSDPGTAIVTVGFFGSCALFTAALIYQKLRRHAHALVRVGVVGGVPIRPSRFLLAALATWMSTLGVITLWVGWYSGIPGYLVSGLLLAGPGFCLAIGLVTGRIPTGYFQFDVSGLTFSGHGSVHTVAWDNIQGIGTGTFNSAPIVLIKLRELTIIDVHPPDRAVRVFRQWAKNETTFGAQIVLHPMRYLVDMNLLLQALDRYVTDPFSRTELTPQQRLPG